MRLPAGRSLAGLLAACLAVLLLAGCSREGADEAGVVAMVNGEPIRAVDLEARHDLRRLGTPVADNPAVERLRVEYGGVLADMIVARLARQELTRLGLSVTDGERAAAEAAVMADYPEGAFERMLVEEHIDRERWREALAENLALDKFLREVLRQNVRVGVSEAANYYKEHIDAFTRPARVRLVRVTGRNPETVKAALAAYRKTGQLASLEGMAGVTVSEAVVPERGLPDSWREAGRSLRPGDASALMQAGKETSFLILLERQPETVLEPAKAYVRVEAILLREKLAGAFEAWLVEALAGARIAVNGRLLSPGQASSDLAGDRPPAGAPHTSPPVKMEVATSGDADRPEAPVVLPEQALPRESRPASAAPPPPPVVADEVSSSVAEAEADAGSQAAPAPAAPAVSAVAPDAPREPAAEAVQSPAAPEPSQGSAASGKDGGGEVEFQAVKASWILYSVDGGQEERVYLKPGKPHRIAYAQRLSVRLGSPSEVVYRHGGRETAVEVGKKESRVLDFP